MAMMIVHISNRTTHLLSIARNIVPVLIKLMVCHHPQYHDSHHILLHGCFVHNTYHHSVASQDKKKNSAYPSFYKEYTPNMYKED